MMESSFITDAFGATAIQDPSCAVTSITVETFEPNAA